VAELPDVEVVAQFSRVPAIVDRNDPFVTVLKECVAGLHETETISVGRDGASDAICFIGAGTPAVEFGPTGAGHHGPAEWVSLASLVDYRRVLVEFVRRLPGRQAEPRLRIA
jgi:succinyl-diaminopimelate desuccinylase